VGYEARRAATAERRQDAARREARPTDYAEGRGSRRAVKEKPESAARRKAYRNEEAKSIETVNEIVESTRLTFPR
jgi:hypothetical protein